MASTLGITSGHYLILTLSPIYLQVENFSLIDVEQKKIIEKQGLIIKEGIISFVGKTNELLLVDSSLPIIDLEGKYLMPGLIDAHTHIFEEPDLRLYEQFNIHEDIDVALYRGLSHLDEYFRSGITSVREMGAISRRNIILRDMAQKHADKPRLVVCGNPITHPNGHFTSRCRIVHNDEYEMQKAVHEEINAGADFIKINNTIALGISKKTLQSAVKEANVLGTFVACHSYTYNAMEIAIDAGVRTLEHVAEFDLNLLKKMTTNNVLPIPTFVAAFDSIPFVNPNAKPDFLTETIFDASFKDFIDWYNWQITNLPILFEKDIEFGIGTDAGFVPTIFDSLHRELELLTKLGATNWQVLRAATIGSAKSLGKEDVLGSIKIGKIADCVVLNSNPLINIQNSRDIHAVIFNGQYYPLQRSY